MNEPTQRRRIYFQCRPNGKWEEIEIDYGSLLYHILFDMPPGEIYQTAEYHYRWEIA